MFRPFEPLDFYAWGLYSVLRPHDPLSVHNITNRQEPMTRTRQVILVIILIFIAYAIYTSPGRASYAVESTWSTIVGAWDTVFAWFDSMLSS
jgi:hypothetical protein